MADLFHHDEQPRLELGDSPRRQSADFDPDEVREEMEIMLAAARSVTADSLWDARTFKYNSLVFPQMARWLPDEEAAQYCFDFAREIERIEALLAA